jgi:hypothetical protein
VGSTLVLQAFHDQVSCAARDLRHDRKARCRPSRGVPRWSCA